METNTYKLTLNFKQILELVQQLPEDEKYALVEELNRTSPSVDTELNKDMIKDVFKNLKPKFTKELGKYTHKRSSDDWFFHGLAFTRESIGYVFGINIGFFREKGKKYYNKLGMNVSIRANGEMPELRGKFITFFRENLKNWVNTEETNYTYSERGGKGVVFPRYAEISAFKSEDEILEFLYDCIIKFKSIYFKIIENPSDIFDKVVRASPQWNETIVEYCKLHLS